MANKKRRLSISSSTLDDASRSATPLVEVNHTLQQGSEHAKAGTDLRAGVEIRKGRGTKGTKGKGEDKAVNHDFRMSWPPYFDSLFKIFRALNTVLAFCSSRKHLAITFSVVRSSVEETIRQPLELARVAELKALLPDMIKFAYIPRNELRVNADVQEPQNGENRKGKRRARSPDFSAFISQSTSQTDYKSIAEEDDHVLVLDFLANGYGKKAENPATSYSLPPALTPRAVQKLIEKRNERFIQAVNELILATPESENAVVVLQAAARDHIPIDPASLKYGGPSKVHHPEPIPDSANRPSVDDVIDEVKLSEWYRGQIIERRVFTEKESQIGTLEKEPSPMVAKALQESRNIKNLYTHQTKAIDAIRNGRHVIVSTATASGKSVIYQVPVCEFLEEDINTTAIYIYPTKALAQDQKLALEHLLNCCPSLNNLHVSTFDGDTPKDDRANIRDHSSVIFTNFDMLHISILPHEEQWRQFFKNLRLVAVDELHYYHGLFGSHVAQIMRRLRRLCTAVGNHRIQFVSCSATISNPLQHMKRIFGVEDIDIILEDGSPAGRKTFVIWDPPYVDEMEPTLGKRSALSECTKLMRFLMARGIRTILFCKIRKACEMAMKALRTELSADGRLDILERVMAYRGGYNHQDRRKIEHEAFSGRLLGLVATNALELGVDIGVLDAVIMWGFPFGLASLRQQAGRAGRRARDSLAIMVADSFPLDRFYVQNPNDLFERSTDDLAIDLESKVILEAHLQCAAFEMPLRAEDEVYFGHLLHSICETNLIKDKDNWYHTHPKFLPHPSKNVPIRGIEEERYMVIDTTNAGAPELLEEIEFSRALFETYEGAVFLHQGLTFLVKEVSHDSRTAKLIRSDVNWTTKPRDFTDIDAAQTYRIREIQASPIRAFYGRVELKTIIFGYFKLRNGAILDAVDLEMPPFERETMGMWLDVPKEVLEILHMKAINVAEAIHSAEHALLNRFAMAPDVKTECKVPQKEYRAEQSQRKRPARLIFYDSAGKDGGLTAKAFDHVSDMLHESFEVVQSCACEFGCSDCIQSPYCKEGNVVSSKLGAQIVIRGLLGLPIDMDSIPDPDIQTEIYPDTIVEAEYVRASEDVEVEPVVN